MNPITFAMNDSGLTTQGNSTDDDLSYQFSILNALKLLVDVSGYSGTTPNQHYAFVLGLLDTYGVSPYAKLAIGRTLNPRIQFYSRGY